MTSSSSSELRKTRVAGVSLILGVIALLVSAAISPGGMFVDSVARTELPEYIDALVDNPTLAHVASLLAILGVLLLINLVIFPAHPHHRQEPDSDRERSHSDHRDHFLPGVRRGDVLGPRRVRGRRGEHVRQGGCKGATWVAPSPCAVQPTLLKYPYSRAALPCTWDRPRPKSLFPLDGRRSGWGWRHGDV